MSDPEGLLEPSRPNYITMVYNYVPSNQETSGRHRVLSELKPGQSLFYGTEVKLDASVTILAQTVCASILVKVQPGPSVTTWSQLSSTQAIEPDIQKREICICTHATITQLRRLPIVRVGSAGSNRQIAF